MIGDSKPHKDEKTEPPSSKRMAKQRSEGNVFMSMELEIALMIFISAWIMKFMSGWLIERIYLITVRCFTDTVFLRLDTGNIGNYFSSLLLFILEMLAPIVVLMIVAGAFATLGQTGWIVSWKAMRIKFEKLIHMNWGELNIFNSKKIVDLSLHILKIALLSIVLYYTLKGSIDDWIPLMDASVFDTLSYIGNLMFALVMKISFFMLVLALIDFLYKRKKYMDDLKMTKWEVKDERKMSDGDPKIKALLKQRRYAFFKKLMMQAVPKADVIITNPTHLAVAVQYDAESMEAPKVVAKGAGRLAEKIRKIAGEHNIPVVENKPLAQVLFKTVEVGSCIPVSLYKAVAEILAYVYKLKNKRAA